MINDHRKFKITILESNGLTTNTNPIILTYVASRAILANLEQNYYAVWMGSLGGCKISIWYNFYVNYMLDNFKLQ